MSTNPTTITTEPGTPFIDIERVVDAAPATVFRAYTEPDLVEQWLGPRSLSMKVEEFDARQGGSYRYVNTDDEGNTYGFRGVFHSVDKDERIIQTFEFDGAPGLVAIETATFEDLGDGRTRVRAHSVFPSVEARDGMAESGMEVGVNEGYERLDELVAKLDA
ncbi:SRPBCC family protein [Solicola gregarius]|uniref:SRPBCC family protein n=1 Tax=Solicola gregarius TaxID=2908642 RepID=A0AA46YN32_9ACTN|nr:SRPBCC family protein [Solicola gregarius]UYM07199.1 SRPBCC family protein [Solicola gregarius]